jgi:hypothetical protein
MNTNTDIKVEGANPAPIESVSDKKIVGTAKKKPTKRASNTTAKKTTPKTSKTTTKTPKKTAAKTAETAVKGGVSVQDKKCDCPICGQGFVPADGISPDVHLAKGVLRVFAQIQEESATDVCAESPLPCPCCGLYRMSARLHKNALCRYEKIYICEICGTDEAVRAYANDILPLPDWWVVREIIGRKKGQ